MIKPIDGFALYVGLGSALFCLRWALMLDPKIAALSQVFFAASPLFAQGPLLLVGKAWGALNGIAQGTMGFSVSGLEFLSECVEGLRFTSSGDGAGGVLVCILGTIALIILFPSFVMLPFMAAEGVGSLVIALLNLSVTGGYLLAKNERRRRPHYQPQFPVYINPPMQDIQHNAAAAA